ncbi:MAG: ExeA family protein [Candidatus Aminicenantaceae bacterium]
MIEFDVSFYLFYNHNFNPHVLNDKYKKEIITMYEQYWQINEKPFENTPDPRFIYLSSEHVEALTRLSYAIEEQKGAALLTGVYGCGKTVISRILFEILPQDKYDICLVTNPMLSSVDLLREICFQLGISHNNGGTKPKLLQSLNNHLFSNMNSHKETVIIIDEAHTIRDIRTFEELRLLLNFQLNYKFLMTLVLIGQPELIKKIEELKPLKQRLATRYHLTPLEKSEIKQYIKHRLEIAGTTQDIFSDPAVDLIWEYSKGIPRMINHVCDISLLIGFSNDKEEIDKDTAEKAIRNLEY